MINKDVVIYEDNRDLIDAVLDEFNFEKVHEAMEALNWTWHHTDGVPTIGELRKGARQRCMDAINNWEKYYKEFDSVEYQYTASSSGGFKASFDGNELELEFIVTSWYEYKYETLD